MHYGKTIKRLSVCLIIVTILLPLARIASPKLQLDHNWIYLSFFPISVSVACFFIFGFSTIIPLFVSWVMVYYYICDVEFVSSVAMVFSLLFPIFVCSLIARKIIGPRWRYSFFRPNSSVNYILFAICSPLLSKVLMLVTGKLIDYDSLFYEYVNFKFTPLNIMNIYDMMLSSTLFSLPAFIFIRSILNFHYGVRFVKEVWQDVKSVNKYFFIITALLVLYLCSPVHGAFSAGFMIPVLFVMFLAASIKGRKISIFMYWALCVYFLLKYNVGYVYSVNKVGSMTLIVSSFTAFTISMHVVSTIKGRLDRINNSYKEQSLRDPFLNVRNIRALTEDIKENEIGALFYIRLMKSDVFERHYGLMMYKHCKKNIATEIYATLKGDGRLYYLPDGAFVIKFNSNDVEEKAKEIIAVLQALVISWNGNLISFRYGFALEKFNSFFIDIYQMIGQLSHSAIESFSTGNSDDINRYVVKNSIENMRETAELLISVDNGIKNRLFSLYVQPIVSGNGVEYYEILSRLFVNGEMVLPNKFIDVIQQFDLCREFDLMVVDDVLQHIKQHFSYGCDEQKCLFSVNLMALTLAKTSIVDDMVTLFEKHGVPHDCITFEVTEEPISHNSVNFISSIEGLRAKGFKIAIDDFGTGLSNYERFKKLDADVIKIDGSFIKNIESDNIDRMIVKSICDMAKIKNIPVVAEYVENENQQSILKTMGVEFMQGYHFSAPAPIASIIN